jgi:hypothetical protein
MQVSTSASTIYCVLCHKPVEIETAKTDAKGQPVHSECYAQSLARPADDFENPSRRV